MPEINIPEWLKWASQLPFVAKVLLSGVFVLLAGVALTVMWTPEGKTVGAKPPIVVPPNGGARPAIKTLEELRATLRNISGKNAQLLKVVAAANQFGIYVPEVVQKLHWTETDVVYRAKELERDGLVEVRSLTQYNLRLPENLDILPGAKELINGLP